MSGLPIEFPISELLASDKPLLIIKSDVLIVVQKACAANSSTLKKLENKTKLWKVQPSVMNMMRLGISIFENPEELSAALNVFHVKNGVFDLRTSSCKRLIKDITMSLKRLEAEVARAMARTGLSGRSSMSFKRNGMWQIVPAACASICVKDFW